MSEPSNRAAEVAALREQFLPQAAEAFDLMFHPEHQRGLDTLDRREGRVVELMGGLGCWLLERQTNADAAAQPSAGQPVACLKCGRPARRVCDPDDPLPCRPLTTLTGEVRLQRHKFSCTTCRVVFFPPRP